MKDPERYLKEHGVGFRCAVEPARSARIEPALRAFVNHEIFYCSDSQARARFLEDPLRYCGWVTDPVTRQRFQPTTRSPRFFHAGRPYFFRDRLSFRAFVAMPDSFAHRRGG